MSTTNSILVASNVSYFVAGALLNTTTIVYFLLRTKKKGPPIRGKESEDEEYWTRTKP
jgi:hypothetical protein